MTRAQARMLMLVLAVKDIPFKLRREGSTYVVQFVAERTKDVAAAIGA